MSEVSQDIRWKQRLTNFKAALSQLRQAVNEGRSRNLSNLEKQGLIQAFDFTHELAWNVFKDYIEYQGYTQMTGSRDATREAFNRQLINNGEVWMEMIQSRNQTTHTYNLATAELITSKVLNQYFSEFETLDAKMTELSKK
jgi:nucleotidyltransferase substrate binding protein (TIGR01987 family)